MDTASCTRPLVSCARPLNVKVSFVCLWNITFPIQKEVRKQRVEEKDLIKTSQDVTIKRHEEMCLVTRENEQREQDYEKGCQVLFGSGCKVLD